MFSLLILLLLPLLLLLLLEAPSAIAKMRLFECDRDIENIWLFDGSPAMIWTQEAWKKRPGINAKET